VTAETSDTLAAHRALVAASLAGQCRIAADHLAGAIAQARARGADTVNSEEALTAWLDWEDVLRRKGGGASGLPRYAPQYPSAKGDGA